MIGDKMATDTSLTFSLLALVILASHQYQTHLMFTTITDNSYLSDKIRFFVIIVSPIFGLIIEFNA